MSRLKSSVSLALAGFWLFASTAYAQVVNFQLPEILGALAGDRIQIGTLTVLTGDAYFATNPTDCTGKFDWDSVGSIAFRTDDPWKENTTRVVSAYASATLGSDVGSHKFTINCKNKLNNSEYAMTGRIEVTTVADDALYGSRGLAISVEMGFVSASINFYKYLGYIPIYLGEANMRKLTADTSDAYFKEGLISPVSPAIFYDTDGVTRLSPFGFISIQQGCKDGDAKEGSVEEECVAIIRDHKSAVFFKKVGSDGALMPRFVKTTERVVQTDESFNFGGCFGAKKLVSGNSQFGLFCWYFNPTTKKTKIVDTRDANKIADFEVGFKIVDQQPQAFGSSAICFLIDELQNKPYKVGCINPLSDLTSLSFFNEVGSTATSSLEVTTTMKSNCTVPISSLSGSNSPFRGLTAFGSCNSSSFSGYVTLDQNVPQVAGGPVLNFSAPLKASGEVITLPPTSTVSGYICNFGNELAYFATVNGNTEINIQGTGTYNIGRLLRTSLGLNGPIKVLSTVCHNRGATVLIEHNSARYVMQVEPPKEKATSLLTRIPIFEKISSTVDTLDPTNDYALGFLYNGNPGAGKQLQFSDVFLFQSAGYLVETYNPSVNTAGTYRTKLTQKSENGPSNSFEVSMTLFDSAPQLSPRAGITSMPTNVNDDLQKYYSLSGNFSSIWLENSTVFTFTPLVASNMSTASYPKNSKPVFVLSNEYLVNLQEGTFTNEKEGSVATAITSRIIENLLFVGLVDTPAGYQVAVLSSLDKESIQLAYFNNKTAKVELTESLKVKNVSMFLGTALPSIDSRGEPSIAIATKPVYNSGNRYIHVKYQVDAASGNVTTPSYEYSALVTSRQVPQGRAVDQYIVHIDEYDADKARFFPYCKLLTVIGGRIRSAMVYPVCALPEYRDVKHFIANATKRDNTLRLEVYSTAATPEHGFGEVVVLEADIFDGSSFRPNRDLVWKVTSLRKFQKFVGHVISVQRKGEEEIIIGQRMRINPETKEFKYIPQGIVFSFFKTDPATPFHQFEEPVEFAAAFEYKNNWFISMYNVISKTGEMGGQKTLAVNYTAPMLKLLPGSNSDSIAAQSITFNKGGPNEVRRAMKAIVSPSSPSSGAESSSSSTWLIVLVSILVVGVLGGVAYYYFIHRRETIRRESDLDRNTTTRITAEQ